MPVTNPQVELDPKYDGRYDHCHAHGCLGSARFICRYDYQQLRYDRLGTVTLRTRLQMCQYHAERWAARHGLVVDLSKLII